MPSDESMRAAASLYTPEQRRAALRLALTGLAAASIEWFDFFLYATAAALVFPTVFFPASLPPYVALIASFSSFAVGFLARPIGGALFGHIGDRKGRKVALGSALLTMGVATMLIGCLPSYATAGVLAPLALVLLRFAQGLAVGGQWGGAILLATENAPEARRGLYGSIPQAGVAVGVVLTNLAFFVTNALTSPAAFMAYGWRILFLCSIALVALAAFIHFRIEDTAAFRELKQAQPAGALAPRERSPLLQSLRRHPRSILLAAGAYISTNLTFYILITYSVAYGTSPAGLHLSRATLLAAVLIATLLATPALFIGGALSDRVGRRRIFMLGLCMEGVWAFALFPLIDTRSFVAITLAICVGQVCNSVTYGPLAALFAELFDTRVRYSAVSLAYQLSSIVGGGLAPLIATALYARYHHNLPLSIYIVAACAVSVLCTWALQEPRNARPISAILQGGT
ncbi:MAG TPA: MFS transporter [Steroidobacteraceae bacterium]|nr:MFS transporter [Steroidobacteraceae bacterium]